MAKSIITLFLIGLALGWFLAPDRNDNLLICKDHVLFMYKTCKRVEILHYKPGTCNKAYNKGLMYCSRIFGK